MCLNDDVVHLVQMLTVHDQTPKSNNKISQMFPTDQHSSQHSFQPDSNSDWIMKNADSGSHDGAVL